MSDIRDPETDQQAPEHQPGSPGMHDIAISCLPHWDVKGGSDDAVRELIRQGLEERRELGLRKYETLLQANNGRDALLDAWQEGLDLLVYTYQIIHEDLGAQVSPLPVLDVLADIARLRLERGEAKLR